MPPFQHVSRHSPPVVPCAYVLFYHFSLMPELSFHITHHPHFAINVVTVSYPPSPVLHCHCSNNISHVTRTAVTATITHTTLSMSHYHIPHHSYCCDRHHHPDYTINVALSYPTSYYTSAVLLLMPHYQPSTSF